MCSDGCEPLNFKRTMKTKPTISEKQILSLLIYQESFHYIQEETGLGFGPIRDDLINLINHRFIEVYNSEQDTSPTTFYDSDRINEFYFKATKTGLRTIQRYAI